MGAVYKKRFGFMVLFQCLLALKEHYAEKRVERRLKRELLHNYENECRERTVPRTEDQLVGWTNETGEWRRKSPFATVTEQLDSLDMTKIQVAATRLRGVITEAAGQGVQAEPFVVMGLGPPRNGKTLLFSMLVRMLDQLGFISTSRSAQDAFCDDLVRAAEEAHQATITKPDGSFRFKFFDGYDPAERAKLCKTEVLFIDEFQSQKTNPPDVPILLNGVTPLPWRPLMANPPNKGVSVKPLLWFLSANHEYSEHNYSVCAIRDRVHLRVVVIDGKAYEQRCYRKLSPDGNFLGGCRTCQGKFGVWEEYVISQSKATQSGVSAGFSTPSAMSETVSRSVSRGVVVTNQKVKIVKDFSQVDKARCGHLRMMGFTDLICYVLNATADKVQRSIDASSVVDRKLANICQFAGAAATEGSPSAAMEQCLDEFVPAAHISAAASVEPMGETEEDVSTLSEWEARLNAETPNCSEPGFDLGPHSD